MMSSLVRRLVIFATIEGLVIQGHGSTEQHRSILIEYGTQRVSERARGSHTHTHSSPRLEAFGIIGFVDIAAFSHLIAITKRDEVAQIFGKPIYLVTDVAVLPLSSQREANEAIKDILSNLDIASDRSDSSSDSEDGQGDHGITDKIPPSSNEEVRPYQSKHSSSTSVAEDVATRNISFGRFATQWLYKQRWPGAASQPQSSDNAIGEPGSVSKQDPATGHQTITTQQQPNVKPETSQMLSQGSVNKTSATIGLLPRILKTMKMIFTSGSYFFSYDIDLTRRFEHLHATDELFNFSSLDSVFFWNRKLGSKLLNNTFSNFLTPVIQGFVGQRAFVLVKNSPSESNQSQVANVVDHPDHLKNDSMADADGQAFLLTLISRRSTKRSGLRYLRRGIDDEGNVANFVETEQILSAADWNPDFPTRSFVQVRGSIPLYYSQSPYSFKPAVVFQNSPQINERAYSKHFQMLQKQYGAIQIALLVDRHGTEKPIGDAYEKMYMKSKEDNRATGISFDWFDFHSECRGMKFENVSRLVSKLDPFLEEAGETTLHNGKLLSRQSGVIRTNCMDCLDRTNVAQSAFAQHKLQKALKQEGYMIDFVADMSTNWFNILWADNGDAISRQYASTAALKGDFTRTRKRNWRGAMNDLGLTLSRYYSNMVNDYFSQAVLDVLLGNVSWKVFEDFESTMMSVDPGISVQSGRENAISTCSKIVIQNPEKEDILHAWTMLVPNQENTLRTLPLEEAVVLLTDSALYCCRLDWTTEKIALYEKVDLRNVRSIKTGVYITSTFTERQRNEEVNQGLVIYYKPGDGDLVRVNTRSLQNYHVPEGERQGVDGGTGILSWMAASTSKQATFRERIMALKVVPPAEYEGTSEASGAENPKQLAEDIADQIRRAIFGSTEFGEQRGQELVEHGDIISVAEAMKRTGYLEQVTHSLKKLVWA